MDKEHGESKDHRPAGLDPWSALIRVEAETLDGMRKEARTVGSGSFTMYSDEPASIGGGGTAPAPTQLFAASVLF